MFFLQATCRPQNVDSLIGLVRPGINDTVQIRLLNKIAYQIMETDAENGLKYANEAMRRAQKINDQGGIANACNVIGVCYDVIGNYDSALFYYKKALNSPSVQSHIPSQAGAYSNIGLVYWNLDNYPEALANFNKARHLIEGTEHTHFLAVILNNTGLIYHDMKDYPQSTAFFKRAIAVYQKDKDTLGSIGSVINLAINYFETRHYAECENLFGNYMRFVNRLDDYSKSEFLVNKATLEINTTLTDTTKHYLDESLQLKKQIGHSLGVANVLIQFSEYYTRKGDYVRSNAYAYDALKMTGELKALKKLSSVYDNLFFNYAILNVRDSAQKYRQLYTAINDTMFAEAKAKAFLREQVAFKTFEKEKENLSLLNENNSIRLKNQLIIFSALFLISLSALSFWFYSRIKKQKEIARQKEAVDKLVFETEQAERERIARDLHDSVGQKLSVVKMQMSLHPSDQSRQAMELLDKAIHDVRVVSHDLFPEELGKGLFAALEDMAAQINYTSASTKLRLSLPPDPSAIGLSRQTELYLYRIIQEQTNNALKYAQAGNIHISMEVKSEQLQVILSDDGVGLPETATPTDGIGMKNMKARIDQLKGKLQIVSRPHGGTQFMISIPL